MQALSALYKATAREFLRDRVALLLTVLLPLILAAFFGMIFSSATGQAALYVPGMMALAILWMGVFTVAPPLVQMRESQVLRRLGATPLRRSTLLGAQVLFRLTTGLLQAALLIGYGLIAYRMTVTWEWLLMLAAQVLGTMVMISLGFLLAGLARSNESCVALGQLIQFPMMFLSGILFPLEMLPSFLRPVTNLMPLTYVSDALKQTMLGAPALFPLWVDFAVLGGFLIVLAGLAVRFFRWE
ncbi:MAG: ABC transporter permease [Mycobacterium leprae]